MCTGRLDGGQEDVVIQDEQLSRNAALYCGASIQHSCPAVVAHVYDCVAAAASGSRQENDPKHYKEQR